MIMRHVVIRIDDVCPDMDYVKFSRIRDMLLKYRIAPLIGIIPKNEDTSLKEYRDETAPSDDEIWAELLHLHKQYDWCVALHGFKHKYTSKSSGLLEINEYSEFAGIDYLVQENKIECGLETLQKKGFSVVAFMAPAHSFDKNTLKILEKHNMALTDGKGIYPYIMGSKTWAVPVPYSVFWDIIPFGIYSICLHPNTMREKDFSRLERFLKRKATACCNFNDVLLMIKPLSSTPIVWRVLNYVSHLIMKKIITIIGLILRRT